MAKGVLGAIQIELLLEGGGQVGVLCRQGQFKGGLGGLNCRFVLAGFGISRCQGCQGAGLPVAGEVTESLSQSDRLDAVAQVSSGLGR